MAVSAPALAQDTGWYLGGDVGRTELKSDSSVDLSDTAFGVHGGYRIATYFAVEAGYADLGSDSYTFYCPTGRICVPESYPVDVEASAARAELSLQASIPLGERFEAYAKAGVARTEIETEWRSLAYQGSTKDSSTDAIYGVGARLHFDAPWSLRLQWDRTAVVGDRGADIDGWWLGVEYRFTGR